MQRPEGLALRPFCFSLRLACVRARGDAGGMHAVRIVVHGRVQGVGFRAHVVRVARELGVTGWVRNLPEGDVEAEAVGTKMALERFVEEVRTGPMPARVEHAAVQWFETPEARPGFEVVR
jgi:acylphosphatase